MAGGPFTITVRRRLCRRWQVPIWWLLRRPRWIVTTIPGAYVKEMRIAPDLSVGVDWETR